MNNANSNKSLLDAYIEWCKSDSLKTDEKNKTKLVEIYTENESKIFKICDDTRDYGTFTSINDVVRKYNTSEGINAIYEVFNKVISRDTYNKKHRDFPSSRYSLDSQVSLKSNLENMCLGEYNDANTLCEFLLLLEVLITYDHCDIVSKLLEKRDLLSTHMTSSLKSDLTFEILPVLYVHGVWSSLLKILNSIGCRKQYENVIEIITSSPSKQLNKIFAEASDKSKYISYGPEYGIKEPNYAAAKYLADKNFDVKSVSHNMDKNQLLAQLLYEILVNYSYKFADFFNDHNNNHEKRSWYDQNSGTFYCNKILFFCSGSKLHCAEILNLFLKLQNNSNLSKNHIEYLCDKYFKGLTIRNGFKALLKFYAECEESNDLDYGTLPNSWRPIGFSTGEFVCKLIENPNYLLYMKKYKILIEKHPEIQEKLMNIDYIKKVIRLRNIRSLRNFFVIFSFVVPKELLVDNYIIAKRSLQLFTEKKILPHEFFDDNTFIYLVDGMIRKHSSVVIFFNLNHLQLLLKKKVHMRCLVINKMKSMLDKTNELNSYPLLHKMCFNKTDEEVDEEFISFIENGQNKQLIYMLLNVDIEAKKILDNIVAGETEFKEIVFLQDKHVVDYLNEANLYQCLILFKKIKYHGYLKVLTQFLKCLSIISHHRREIFTEYVQKLCNFREKYEKSDSEPNTKTELKAFLEGLNLEVDIKSLYSFHYRYS